MPRRSLPERKQVAGRSASENIGMAINNAMRAIERENPDLKDVLPKTYNRMENATLIELLKLMESIPMDIEGERVRKDI